MSQQINKHTMGIDEAGRGPVLGPMVMAGVVLDTAAARTLSRAGLRDSKAFGAGAKAAARRRELAQQVRSLAAFYEVRVLDVALIDKRVRRGELNVLEREVACAIIDRAPAVDRIVSDGKTLFGPLQDKYDNLQAFDRGEDRHAAVAAASVLAKVRRDHIFECIVARYRPRFGAIAGGGYVNARTRAFLREYARAFGRLPPEARRSWPHGYLHDILGPDFDPYGDVPNQQTGQLRLL